MARRIRASTIFNLVVLAIGIVAFGFVVDHLGWSGIEQAVVSTGAWFVVIALIDLFSATFDAFSIYGFLRPKQRVSYWRVYAAQLSGMAINRLTPGNSLGEPVKVTMLVRSVPVEHAVSAVVMFNLTTMYVGIAAIVVGVPLTALLLDLPERIALIVWIGLAVLVVFAIAVAILVRRGALATLIDGLVGLHVISAARGTRWRAKIVAIDGRLRGIGDTRNSGIVAGLAGVLGSRVTNWVGTIVVLYAADIPMTAPLVIASLSVGILVTWMSNVVPLGLGLADGTNYVLYGLLGAAPVAGLTFTLLNRLRTVVLALLGLTAMAIANALHRRNTPVSAPSVISETP
ncbi:MAG TPA: lysylphosphatidylglycerol synthase transmembrane domain-containing protein [Kofleriaceae bacterium]